MTEPEKNLLCIHDNYSLTQSQEQRLQKPFGKGLVRLSIRKWGPTQSWSVGFYTAAYEDPGLWFWRYFTPDCSVTFTVK
jgi:hypothetical protein